MSAAQIPVLRLAALASLLTAGCGDAPHAPNGDTVSVTLRETSAPPATALPEVRGVRDPRRPLVVIDPGHGGGDPGTTSPAGTHEKDVTLAVARAVRDALAASGRVRVALTRDGDGALPLERRIAIARRLGAALFISIHADAAPNNAGARGASIYTLSEVASDREAVLLARRENAGAALGGADRGEGDEVNRILVDLAQRESMEASARFARLLHREASGLIPFQRDHHRLASLIVLKAPDIPSILFECGYLTNAEDEAFLRSAAARERIADGMRRAIVTHFAREAVGRGG